MKIVYYDKNGLGRDLLDHRVGFKCQIKLRRPMSREGWSHWGIKQRLHLAKHRCVWVYYSSSRAVGLKEGIPIEYMSNNKKMVHYLIDRFLLANNETYALHGYCHRKTRFHCGLTKALAIITVYDADNKKYDIKNTKLLSRYWFRKDERNRLKKLWGEE